MTRGILVVISGFSGAGKGTVLKEMISRHTGYAFSVSATTREPRPGETEGRDYFFCTQEEFDRMVEEDAFLEYASYVKHSYGTPRSFVEKSLEEGLDVLLEIDLQGALQVKEKYPETPCVFITPPSILELQRRLKKRGSEADEVITGRLQRAFQEAKFMDSYDYILVNDDASDCARRLHNLIQSVHAQTKHNQYLIAKIRNEAESLAHL